MLAKLKTQMGDLGKNQSFKRERAQKKARYVDNLRGQLRQKLELRKEKK